MDVACGLFREQENNLDHIDTISAGFGDCIQNIKISTQAFGSQYAIEALKSLFHEFLVFAS